MQYHQFHAMNTTITLGAEEPQHTAVFTMAKGFIERNEKRFTRFMPDSELSALNRSAGTWFYASSEMMGLLDAAVECHKITNGLFDPSILPDLQAIGYTCSLGDISTSDAEPSLATHSRTSSSLFSEMELEFTKGRVCLPEGMQIDLGGIAKGWIAENAAKCVTGFSPACAVNAGGDMFLIGQPQGQAVWEVVLEDPLDPSRDLMTLLVEGGAVATSSVTKRTWNQEGMKRHHIINPHTGGPAESPWLSVTVFAPKAVLAETFAKAILIAGPNQSQSLLDDHPEISFLAVDAEGYIWTSPTEKERIHEYA